MNDEMLTPDIGDDDDGLEPLAWLDLLEQQVEVQRKHARHYDRYYANEAELEIVKNEYEEVFGPAALQEHSRPPISGVRSVGPDLPAFVAFQRVSKMLLGQLPLFHRRCQQAEIV